MTRIALRNGTFVSLLPQVRVTRGDLVLEDGVVEALGEGVARGDGIDLGGAMVLPGLVNGHTHLYSALAAGMPAPPKAPGNFVEILQWIWWRLDRALDAESVYLSALVGGLEAARSGVTALIDHHASPSAIEGSLDQVARGLGEVGVSGALCYEVTDRGGPEQARAGIAENVRFARRPPPGFVGLIGGHASFTLTDDTLKALGAAVRETGRPFHVHVAEDRADLEPGDPVARFLQAGLLTSGAVMAHAVHLPADSLRRALEAGATVAHQPRSNMNNAVGYARLAAAADRVMVGTDGIGSDVLSEVRIAFLKAREQGSPEAWTLPVRLLQGALECAGGLLGRPLGRIQEGAPADLVITDYAPFTPLSADNFAGHLLFGFDRSNIRQVVAQGRTIWPTPLDTADISRRSQAAAADLWERLQTLTPL